MLARRLGKAVSFHGRQQFTGARQTVAPLHRRSGGGNMPSTVWKGYISFGLISVPIRLYSAARYSHLAFHEIHRECGTRVHQQLYCPHDEEVVSRDEIAMGYEVEKDKYVLVDRSELKTLQPRSSTAMEIIQ